MVSIYLPMDEKKPLMGRLSGLQAVVIEPWGYLSLGLRWMAWSEA